MYKHPVKYNRNQKNNSQSQTETWKHNWEVLKPFVHFGFKAMAIIGGAMISIIKLVPELLDHHKEPPKKDNRIIKI